MIRRSVVRFSEVIAFGAYGNAPLIVNNTMEPVRIVGTEILGGDKWLELRRMELSDHSFYTYSHEVGCAGRIVAVLPYRRSKIDFGLHKTGWEFAVRAETTPCWCTQLEQLEPSLSSITGGIEAGEMPHVAACRELQEEAGYKVTQNTLRFLGLCRGTKSSNTLYHLFAVDVTNLTPAKAKGDGSPRDLAPLVWTTVGEADERIVDPFVYTMVVRAGLL